MAQPELALLRQALSLSGAGTSDFDLNPDAVLPKERVLKSAGVLIAIDVFGAAPRVVLTKRAAHLKHHPGQIAFPGGRQDPGDVDATDAALREAEEEIALPRTNIEVLGTLPQHETVTGYLVTPTVGLITAPFEERAEAGEVSEIFSVPLAHVTDPTRFCIQGRQWQGRRRLYYTVPYGPYYIWGATARILRLLAERMTM